MCCMPKLFQQGKEGEEKKNCLNLEAGNIHTYERKRLTLRGGIPLSPNPLTVFIRLPHDYHPVIFIRSRNRFSLSIIEQAVLNVCAY